MRLWSVHSGRGLRLGAIVAVLALAALGCAENYPQTTLSPEGDFARMVDDVPGIDGPGRRRPSRR